MNRQISPRLAHMLILCTAQSSAMKNIRYQHQTSVVLHQTFNHMSSNKTFCTFFFYCRFLLLSASTWAIFLSFEIHWLEVCTKFQKEGPVAFLFIVKCHWHCPKSVNGYLLGASFQHWHASIEINTCGQTMTNFHALWYVMAQKDVWQLKASVLVKYDMFCRHSYPGCDGLWLSWMFQNEELESRHGRQ